MPNGRKIVSKLQWKALQAKAANGEMSKADLDDMIDASPSYEDLPYRKHKGMSNESFERWTTPDIRGMLDRQDEEMGAPSAPPGMAGVNMPGVTTKVNVAPYQGPVFGKKRKKTDMLRRAWPKK